MIETFLSSISVSFSGCNTSDGCIGVYSLYRMLICVTLFAVALTLAVNEHWKNSFLPPSSLCVSTSGIFQLSRFYVPHTAYVCQAP